MTEQLSRKIKGRLNSLSAACLRANGNLDDELEFISGHLLFSPEESAQILSKKQKGFSTARLNNINAHLSQMEQKYRRLIATSCVVDDKPVVFLVLPKGY